MAKSEQHGYLVAVTQKRLLVGGLAISLLAGLLGGLVAYGSTKPLHKQIAALQAALQVERTVTATPFGAKHTETPPPAGYCVWGRIVEVHDGDTVVFRMTYDIPVRLLGCWAPEVTGVDKAAGIASRDHLAKYVGVVGGVRAVLPEQPDRLVIALEHQGAPSRTDKFTNMGRTVGRVYSGDTNIAELQISRGFAKEVKE